MPKLFEQIEHSWTQDESRVWITARIGGVKASEMDLVSTERFLKLTVGNKLLQLDLAHPVRDSAAECRLTSTHILFTLPKTTPGTHWDSLVVSNKLNSSEVSAARTASLAARAAEKPSSSTTPDSQPGSKTSNSTSNESQSINDPSLPPIRSQSTVYTTFSDSATPPGIPARPSNKITQQPDLPNKNSSSNVETENLNPQVASGAKEAGDKAFKAGNVDAAITAYTTAVKAGGGVDALANRAAAFVAKSDWDAAVDDASAALEKLSMETRKGSTDRTRMKAKLLMRRGLARAARGDSQGALTDYTEATELLPGDAEVAAAVAALKTQ